jgi:hypothetical protein
MRTYAEDLEFAKACEQIEKEGGDVQGYIAQEYPSYTPRAVWYRLQRNQLGRDTLQLTEGRPKEKGVKYMGKMMELAQGCLDAYGRGEKVFDYLRSQGSKNPSAYWYQIKQTAKLQDPDLYEKLSVIRTNDRKPHQEASKAPVTVDLGEHPEQVKEAVNRVFFGGKEYEKLEGEGKPKPSPTCCQPARESGVTLDDMPLEIVGIMSNVKGYYQKSCIENKHLPGIDGQYVHLIWRDLVTHDERSLGLSVSEWLQLAEEIPKAMRQLGFMKP